MTSSWTLGDWFKSREAELRELVPEVAQAVSSLTGNADWDTALHAYVLGAAGVGKSSLINALLNDRLTVLPHGGFGPQTACATHIGFSRNPFLTISYAGDDRIEQIVRSVAGGDDPQALQKAGLLVEGMQFGQSPSAYLLASLEHARRGVLWPDANERDRGRLSVLADLLAPNTARVTTREAGEDLPAFLLDLQTHAAGFLSPIVEGVKIGWDASILTPGLELVDLPGVGIANDSYRSATSEALRGAKCVLLVVDRAGLTREVADALTPFFAECFTPQVAPPQLIVAVVKIDLVVGERRARETGSGRGSWLDHFDSVATDLVRLVRGQLRAELRRSFPSARNEQLADVIRRVLIRPVAPVEHLRLHRRDPDDAARIAHADDSRVPALRGVLRDLALAHRASVEQELVEALDARRSRDIRYGSRIAQLQEEIGRAS